MTTEAQLAANRANARRSTGPKSQAGKARAALNALEHGFRSQIVLQRASAPDAATYAAYLASLVALLRPVGPLESQCVETIALAAWRKRLVIQKEFDLQDEPAPDAYDFVDRTIFDTPDPDDFPAPPLPPAPPPPQIILPCPEKLLPLLRYEAHLTREHRFAFRQLRDLQSERLAAHPDDPRPPSPAPVPTTDTSQNVPNESRIEPAPPRSIETSAFPKQPNPAPARAPESAPVTPSRPSPDTVTSLPVPVNRLLFGAPVDAPPSRLASSSQPAHSPPPAPAIEPATSLETIGYPIRLSVANPLMPRPTPLTPSLSEPKLLLHPVSPPSPFPSYALSADSSLVHFRVPVVPIEPNLVPCLLDLSSFIPSIPPESLHSSPSPSRAFRGVPRFRVPNGPESLIGFLIPVLPIEPNLVACHSHPHSRPASISPKSLHFAPSPFRAFRGVPRFRVPNGPKSLTNLLVPFVPIEPNLIVPFVGTSSPFRAFRGVPRFRAPNDPASLAGFLLPLVPIEPNLVAHCRPAPSPFRAFCGVPCFRVPNVFVFLSASWLVRW